MIKKRLTEMQAGICSLEQAWLFYLPDFQPPSLPRVCFWLRTASLARILSLIEEVSRQGGTREPRLWINDKLKGSAQ